MIEYQCPYCDEAMESPDGMTGSEEVCPACGALVEIPDGRDVIVPGGSPPLFPNLESVEWGTGPEELRLLAKLVSGTAMCVAGLALSVGSIALHLWTTYLVYDNWGTFWGIVAFFSPPFVEVVACVACFWWGMWFYLLAPLTLLTGLICFYTAQEHSRKIAWVAITLIAFVATGAAFGYLLVGHYLGPTRITPKLRAELEQVGVAVCSVLAGSLSNDPLEMAQLAEAKSSLRERLAECDDAELAEVRQTVHAFLRFVYLLQGDFTSHLENANKDSTSDFTMQEGTRKAMEALPARFRAELGPKQVALMERTIAEQVDDVGSDWRETIEAAFERQWRIFGQTYSYLLRKPMPRPQDLVSSE